jgi:hypothetical protein
MAAWRHRETARIEPPLWYRVYDAAAWDQPDREEQAMIDGCAGYRAWPDSEESRWGPDWPQRLHEHHARRRWAQAQHAYRQRHPALAEQEFADLQTSYRDRHGS